MPFVNSYVQTNKVFCDTSLRWLFFFLRVNFTTSRTGHLFGQTLHVETFQLFFVRAENAMRIYRLSPLSVRLREDVLETNYHWNSPSKNQAEENTTL